MNEEIVVNFCQTAYSAIKLNLSEKQIPKKSYFHVWNYELMIQSEKRVYSEAP